MAGQAFDPNGSLRFDLRSGAASDARGTRVLIVPSASIESLDKGAQEKLGGDVGRACGARVASRLGGDSGVRSAQLEVVVSHVAGELAVAGVGAVHIERWGRALVAVVANASVGTDAFVGAAVAGAMSAASGRELFAAALGQDKNGARYFLGSRTTCDRVRGLVAEGGPYAEVVAHLQGGVA